MCCSSWVSSYWVTVAIAISASYVANSRMKVLFSRLHLDSKSLAWCSSTDASSGAYHDDSMPPIYMLSAAVSLVKQQDPAPAFPQGGMHISISAMQRLNW